MRSPTAIRPGRASAMRTHILSSIGTARGTRIADEDGQLALRNAGRTRTEDA